MKIGAVTQLTLRGVNLATRNMSCKTAQAFWLGYYAFGKIPEGNTLIEEMQPGQQPFIA